MKLNKESASASRAPRRKVAGRSSLAEEMEPIIAEIRGNLESFDLAPRLVLCGAYRHEWRNMLALQLHRPVEQAEWSLVDCMMDTVGIGPESCMKMGKSAQGNAKLSHLDPLYAWTLFSGIAKRLGVSRSQVSQVAHGKRRSVRVKTALLRAIARDRAVHMAAAD